jgi:hypothetical protein
MLSLDLPLYLRDLFFENVHIYDCSRSEKVQMENKFCLSSYI